MCSLAQNSAIKHPESTNLDGFLRAFVAFYVLICAIRYNVGCDCMSYAYIFTHGTGGVRNGEVLFYLLSRFSADWNLHYALPFAVCAFLQIYPITKALKEYKYILITLPLVLFGGRYFQDLNNGVRQMIVASMFVYASRYIVDRKPLYYAAFIFLGSMIHQSALMLIPFYFVPRWLSLAKMRWVMMGIFTFCFVAGQTPAFQNFVGYAEYLAGTFGYAGYGSRMGAMLAAETNEALAFGPMMLSYLLAAYAIIWFGPTLKQTYGKKIPYFDIWYNLSFFFACAYFLVCNISHIFIRPVQYFELFQMIMVALLLYEFRAHRRLLYLAFLVIVWTNTTWAIYKYHRSPLESSTYKVFFLHQDEVRRWLRR